MIDTVKWVANKAFGLNIMSEIPLPELAQIHIEDDAADIVIKKADLTTLWSEQSDSSNCFVIKENLVMFQITGTATFLIQHGNEIIVSPMEAAQDDELRLYILGTCMGALLMQRKVLPLHGSAIVIGGKAYAIVGDSGVGKSTLASAFLRRGYQLLSDDVIPVTVTNENIPVVTPAYPHQKLWLESLNQFGMKSCDYQPIVDRVTKFSVPVQSQFAREPVPLAGVFELVKVDNGEAEVHPILNLQRLHTLFNHTYRNFLIANSGLMEWHFRTSVRIINKIDLFQLRRPASGFTAYDLTDLILTTLKMEEQVYD